MADVIITGAELRKLLSERAARIFARPRAAAVDEGTATDTAPNADER